jgi:hypothetical protein
MRHRKKNTRRLHIAVQASRLCCWTALIGAACCPNTAQAKPCPTINTSIDQQEIDPTQPTTFSIWIETNKEAITIPHVVTLLFVPNTHVEVDPSSLDLPSSGVRTQATLRVKGINPGLVSLIGKIPQWPKECTALNLPIDTGLNAVAKLNTDLIQTDPVTGAREHLMGGDTKTFTILFKNVAGNDVRIGAPVNVSLDVSAGNLSKDQKDWKPQILVPTFENSSQSETVFLRLPNGSQKNANIHVHVLRTSGGRELLGGEIAFDYDYAWWQRLLAIIAGCLVYSVIEAFSSSSLGKFNRTAFGYKVLLIIAIGGLAYIVEDSKILGFEVDKTTIKGNVLFGVLVGCLGLEGVINRIREFAQVPTKPQSKL